MARTLTTRVTALESDIAEIKGSLTALLAHLDPQAPAKTAPKARKAAQPKAAPKAEPKADVRHLTKGNRAEFAKAHPWAKGMSTREIASALASGQRRCKKGWALGAGYRALVTK